MTDVEKFKLFETACAKFAKSADVFMGAVKEIKRDVADLKLLTAPEITEVPDDNKGDFRPEVDE